MGNKNKKVTIGFRYYMNVLLTLCHSSNSKLELVEIRVGGRTAWEGSVNTSQTIHIDKQDLFGGDRKEGGVRGYVDIMMGESNQELNQYLGTSMRKAEIEGYLPAYRGTCNLFFSGFIKNTEFPDNPTFTRTVTDYDLGGTLVATPGPPTFYWSAMTPYFKAVAAKLRRYAEWYPEKARIGNDANPAHILYECLTNVEWGMGLPVGQVDDALFRTCADALYTEEFGLSLTWTDSVSIEDFIKMLFRHISAVLNQNRLTGKLFPKLVRKDYDVDDLFVVNSDNANLTAFSRPSNGEIINEVVVTYTNSEGDPDTVSVQDLAGIANQRAIISSAAELPGIRNPILAGRVGQRELNALITPVSKVSLVMNRTGFVLYEGDVFKLVWPDLGIEAAYFRILELDLGRLEDNQIRVEAIEDVFGLPESSYLEPQLSGWVNPISEAAPSPSRKLQEVPYYDVARRIPTVEETFCYVGMYAESPSEDAYDYNLWTATGQTIILGVPTDNPLELKIVAEFAPVLVLDGDLVKEEFSTFTVESLSPLSDEEISVGSCLVMDEEYMRVDFVDVETNEVTVARGVLDTVPVVHSSGVKMYFTQDSLGTDSIVYLPSEEVRVAVQTRTSLGLLDIEDAPVDEITMVGRQDKPYSPGKFRINMLSYPEKINGDLTISWATRNRLTQVAEVIAQDYMSISPEINSQVVLQIQIEGGSLTTTYPTGTTVTVPVVANPSDTPLVDAGTDRDIRGSGFTEITSAESTSLTEGAGDGYAQPYRYSKINGGWIGSKGFSTYPTRFVATTTGTITDNTFWTGTVAKPKTLPWSLKDGVLEWYDSLGLWSSQFSGASWATGVRAIDYVGIQTYWYDSVGVSSTVSSASSVHNSEPMSVQKPFRDRRATPMNIVTKHRGNYDLNFTTLTIHDMKKLTRLDMTLCAAQMSDIAANNHITTKQAVVGAYFTSATEFDSATGAGTGLSTTNFKYIRDELDIIVSDLLYVYVAAPSGSTTNTSGKPSNVASVLTAHVDFISSTGTTTQTRRYKISSSGVWSTVDSRSGIYMADLFDGGAGTGFEVSESSLLVNEINLSTGAVIGPIGTLTVTPRLVYGDPVNSYIYVLDTTYLLSKFDSTLTLVASIQLPVNSELVAIDESLNYIYVHGGGSIFRADKALSAVAPVFGYRDRGTYFSDAASTVLLASSTEDHPYSGADYGLADEDGISEAQYSAATARTGDEVTINLGATKLGNASYQKHTHTIKRSGYGLRWDEYYGD